ncbi:MULTISPECIES: phosphatase [Fusobacterium]|uniref:phosphatase n=1 Tax=Fusobacterium TaxID=848 RepID=UPI00147704E3|nr:MULTISPECIES: phosphatase [Fusobacterium]NME35462.1 phosphatase [Fusobacterium sp. FSA-380-WT-3A]
MNYKIDLHVHSNTNPHAFSTIEENVNFACENGMEVIAITNHGPALLDTPHWWQLLNIKILPEYIKGVRVLKGVEANIIGENGEIDINQAIYKNLDIVLCGFHGCPEYRKNQSIEKNTKAVMNIIKSQKIDILVHPGNKEFPIDFEKVIKTAKENNVAIEINNSSLGGTREGSEERCREVARIAKKYGCYLTVNTDSHYCRLIGKTDLAMEIVNEVEYPEELIINSSIERLNTFLELRKKLRVKEIFDDYIEKRFNY